MTIRNIRRVDTTIERGEEQEKTERERAKGEKHERVGKSDATCTVICLDYLIFRDLVRSQHPVTFNPQTSSGGVVWCYVSMHREPDFSNILSWKREHDLTAMLSRNYVVKLCFNSN